MVAGQRGGWGFGGGWGCDEQRKRHRCHSWRECVCVCVLGGGGDVRDLKTPLPIYGREPVWPSGKAVGW